MAREGSANREWSLELWVWSLGFGVLCLARFPKGGGVPFGCPYSKGLYSISESTLGYLHSGKAPQELQRCSMWGGPIMGSAGLIFMNPCVNSLQDEISFCTRKCFAIRQHMPPKMAHDLRTALLGSWHSGDKACAWEGTTSAGRKF